VPIQVIAAARAVLRRLAIPTIGLSLLGLFSALFVNHPHVYQTVMAAIMKMPFPHPFVDWEWIPSSIECWTKGVDVYASVPCYEPLPTMGFSYSPLWLRVTFLRFVDGWTNLFGLSFAMLFFLSLVLLPPPRTRPDFVITLLATLSSATALAVERANTDLLMFLIIIVSVWSCRLRLPFRLAGYALITLAGLLKFYPMVALIITLRERPAIVVTIALAAGTALAALALSYHDELARIAGNLVPPSYFTTQFSATDLPSGLGVIASKVIRKVAHQDAAVAETFGGLVYRSLLALLIVQAPATAIWFGRRCDLQSAVEKLPTREADFLAVGAALICGCFFAVHNHIYKGIFLLFAVPGLLALSHELPSLRARAAFRGTCLAIVFVLWFMFIEWCIDVAGLGKQPPVVAGPVGYMAWLCNELSWWWIIITLLAVLGAFVLNSELWAMLSRVLPLPARWRVDRGALAETHPSVELGELSGC
jgi:hypothetical protein